MAFNLFSSRTEERTEALPKSDAPFDLKEALKAAEKTRPPDKKTKIERFPIDGLATQAARAHSDVIDAEAELMKAEIELERIVKEGAAIVKELHDRVQAAIFEREKKQAALFRELYRIGALNDVPNVQRLLVDAKDRADGITQPDDYSPTVKLED